MMYLLLIAGCLLLLFRGAQLRPQARPILFILLIGLLYLWGSYFAWNNPSGDPQGSMFRGFDLMVLLIITALFGLAAFMQRRPKEPAGDAVQTRPNWQIAAILTLGAIVLIYFTLAYFL